MTQWTEVVQTDASLQNVKVLNQDQLRDHLPQILDSLSMTLAEAFRQDLKDQAAWRAVKHGQLRWNQNYDISEIIREFSLLRTTLIQEVAQFRELNHEYSEVAWLHAMITLHSFLDEAIRASAEEYVAFCESA